MIDEKIKARKYLSELLRTSKETIEFLYHYLKLMGITKPRSINISELEYIIDESDITEKDKENIKLMLRLIAKNEVNDETIEETLEKVFDEIIFLFKVIAELDKEQKEKFEQQIRLIIQGNDPDIPIIDE